MKKYFKLAAILFFAVFAIQTANAVTISYNLENIEGNRWKYNYTVYNDSPFDIYAVDIYLNEFNSEIEKMITQYPDESRQSIFDAFDMKVAALDGWDTYITAPHIGLGGLVENPTMLSVEALDELLLQGDSLDVFGIAFNWFGDGIPETVGQLFELWGDGWKFLGDGRTSYENIPPPIPEPQTFMLLGTGLVGLAAYYRRKMARK